MEPRFLHPPDPSIRRLSAVVYPVATGVASLAWAAWGGLRRLADGRYLEMLLLVPLALAVWYVAAGIGLRAIRYRDRIWRAPTQSTD